MKSLAEKIRVIVEGEVEDGEEVLEKYSRDTSLFKVKPSVVVFPKHEKDISALVAFVNEHKKEDPTLSLTGRSAGTDMSGGPLNTSIILDFTRSFNAVDVDEDNLKACVEPGVYYRRFEKEILSEHISLPPYPASKNIAALGGMIMNNSGGEKTLRYGQMREFVEEVSMVLSDGNVHRFGAISEEELEKKKAQDTFEGQIYRRLHALLEGNWSIIQKAKPDVSKNASGYALWEIWDREVGTFNVSQLFVGSQGTLGLLSSAMLRLVPESPHRRLIVLFFSSWDDMPKAVNAILPLNPESLEAFDKETLKLGIRFMPAIARRSGSNIFSFMSSFIPEALIGLRMGGLPELVVLAELAEKKRKTLEEKSKKMEEVLSEMGVFHRVMQDEKEAEKYWTVRRESFSLLRGSVVGKVTAPFIDDFCIKPEKIPSFLPKAVALLRDYDIDVNIAGHAGDGNFHIIPLMDLTKQREREKIPHVADEFYDLVISYGGTITAEHNDGLIRSHYLTSMYGEKVVKLFEEVKNIFDPHNIFNPGKKVYPDKEFAINHISGE